MTVCVNGGAANYQVFAHFLGRWWGRNYGKFLNPFMIRLSLSGMNLPHHISRIELNWLFQDQNGSRTAGAQEAPKALFNSCS